MADTQEALPLRDRLEHIGDAHEIGNLQECDVDYVARLGLTAHDVPELLTIARQWMEPTEWPEDDDYVAGYAPIHAWRGLAQLRAAEAISPLLEMMEPLDANDDDWYMEEFPFVFAWIGPTALAPLSNYLADASHEIHPRVTAADGLREIAKRQPQHRDDTVKLLCETLSKFQENDRELNAFLICNLLELKAKEAAELIERAYAADRVDVSILGNWNMVQEDLGVSSLGLVPEHLAGQEWKWGPEYYPDKDDKEEDDLQNMPDFDYSSEDGIEPIMPIQASPKIGRNEPCPCGSGKKYKKCCGR